MTRPVSDTPRLSGLSLTQMRNYPALNLAIDAPMAVFTGCNGAGKTNLLEAVSLLSPGRGLRRAPFDAITRHGAETGWAVSAILQHEGGETRLGTGTAGLEAGERGRRVRINGAAATAESLLDHLRVLWLTPAMDGLFTGPAGDRRRFLDRLVLAIDPRHGRRVSEFEKLLTSRNRLLEEHGDSGVLDAIEAQLAERAVAVSLARAETVSLLQSVLESQTGTRDSGTMFPVAALALQGAFEERISGQPASRAETAFAADLAACRARDRAAGRTLDGPHRSDLSVHFAEKSMPAALSSTGEQKALLTGLVLGHAGLVSQTTGMTPILLLDEIAAHLDSGRRAALFDRLERLGCQTLMTGTDEALFAALKGRATFFSVDSGQVT